MRSTFFGIDIARRALQAQQRALDVVGHNIANANTPGYSRQVAIQATTPPYTYPSRHMPTGAGQVGTGVQITAIRRVRDEFIDMQLRNETESVGRWQARRDALHQVELIFLEPSDLSLRARWTSSGSRCRTCTCSRKATRPGRWSGSGRCL